MARSATSEPQGHAPAPQAPGAKRRSSVEDEATEVVSQNKNPE